MTLLTFERKNKAAVRDLRIVGTGNSSLDQLAFYQKGGFRICGVDRDFFVQNYDQQIVENAIQCLDMIRLSMEL